MSKDTSKGSMSRSDMIFGLIVLLWLAVTSVVVYQLPPVEILGYSARLLYFHVPMAWISVVAFLMGAWWSFRYLRTKERKHFDSSSISIKIGFIFCILATISGAIYAKLSTWNSFWNWDVRQTTIFILLLIYAAYIVLGYSIEDEEKKARISAVYALLSFITVPFLVFIIPRIQNFTLHPSLINSEEKASGFSMEPNGILALMMAIVGCTALYIWFLRYGIARKRRKDDDSAEDAENTESAILENGDDQR